MRITINEELRKYIDPLTDGEHAMLERSLLAEGCRDALVLWGETLIDGHNRYDICRKHGIAFNTVQNDSFEAIEQVMLWMIDNQLSRRSVTDFQRGMLALRKKELLAAAQPIAAPGSQSDPADVLPAAPVSVKTSRKDVAQIAGVSSHTIAQIEKIQKTATPELIDAVRVGAISIGAAAAVASLASGEQVAAVAGGKKELRQVARQVRQAKAPLKPVLAQAARSEQADAAAQTGEVAALKATIVALNAENRALKENVALLAAALEQARQAA